MTTQTPDIASVSTQAVITIAAPLARLLGTVATWGPIADAVCCREVLA